MGGHGLLALDWHSGNRSVLMDHELSGVLVGLTLATRPEEIWRALLEATAFGARTVVEAFTAAGVPVDELTAAGGLTANRLLLRIYADVLRRPLHVLDAAHPAALGAAIHAAVAAGAYPDVEAASAAMGARHRETWRPDPAAPPPYDDLYAEYRALHDHFGREEPTSCTASAPFATAPTTPPAPVDQEVRVSGKPADQAQLHHRQPHRPVQRHRVGRRADRRLRRPRRAGP
ncbi:FGGY-family carbohydrate kinase, partial [Micromonospora sp. ATA51]|uniref:FGGY-family carbohydrate kinase n=1 Tax=Micromonospora sp. ATA51 TaxID=2806098 RepID=UPI002815915E